MGLVTGLQRIKDEMEKNEPQGDFPKIKWLNVKDGQKVKIWFLQEIDPGSKYYNEKAGLSGVQLEHSNPENWRRKAACSLEDEGQCYGCEQFELGGDNAKKWKAKPRYFSNVLVYETPDSEPYVAVISQGGGDNAITDDLMEFAGNNGGITWLAWMLKREGVKKDTSWTATPIINVDPEAWRPNPLEYDLFDLEAAVYKVPYEKQEAFYNGENQSSGSNSESKPTHDEAW